MGIETVLSSDWPTIATQQLKQLKAVLPVSFWRHDVMLQLF